VEKIKKLPLIGVYVLLAYMPFHLFLSTWLSLYTGAEGLWDSGKDILTVLLLGISILIFFREGLFRSKFFRTIFILGVIYVVIHFLFLLFDYDKLYLRAFFLGTLYNGRIIAWLFIAMIAGYLLSKLPKKKLVKIILIASTITCVIALAQFVLPKDLMEHFGYSIERGAKPSFFIDDKPDFPRVMSTVRDPNSYGAYLIIPICILIVMLLKKSWEIKKTILLLALHLLALLLTFSRSSWIGMFIALSVLLASVYSKQIKQFIKIKYKYIFIAIFSLCLFTFIVKDTYVFQNVILHSDQSTVVADPNELRIQQQNLAITEILRKPLGHGPGTAGLVSIGNPKSTFLTENYFLQIGFEVGVLGLINFIAILTVIYVYAFKEKDKFIKAIILGTFWAYVLIGILNHVWSNESVAAQWWLLTGLVIGFYNTKPNINKKKQIKN